MSAHTLGLIICISVILIALIWDDYYRKNIESDLNKLFNK